MAVTVPPSVAVVAVATCRLLLRSQRTLSIIYYLFIIIIYLLLQRGNALIKNNLMQRQYNNGHVIKVRQPASTGPY